MVLLVLGGISISNNRMVKADTDIMTLRSKELTLVKAMELAQVKLLLAAMDSIVDKDEGTITPERMKLINNNSDFLLKGSMELEAVAATPEEKKNARIIVESIQNFTKIIRVDLKNILTTSAVKLKKIEADFAKIDDILDDSGSTIENNLQILKVFFAEREDLAGLDLVTQMQLSQKELLLAAMDSIIDRNESGINKERMAIIETESGNLSRMYPLLSKHVLTVEEQGMVTKIKTALPVFIKAIKVDLKNLMRKGAGESVAINKSFAVFDDKVDTNGEIVSQSLSAIVNSIQKASNEAIVGLNTGIAASQKIFSIVFGFAILTLLPVLILITRSILLPLKNANSFSREISKGNFDVILDVTQNDEIGELCNSLAVIPATLKDIMKRYEHTVREVERGNLRARFSDDGLHGEFKALVDRSNLGLDTFGKYLDNIPLPLVAMTKDLKLLYLNQAAMDVGNISNTNEYFEKKSCWDVFKTSHCKTENCAGAKACRTGQDQEAETDAHPGGRDMDIKYMASPIVTSTGEVVGVVETIIDQTQVVAMQRKVKNLADKASEISEKLSSSSQELSSQIEQANQGAKVQSSRATETATAMEEMNATVLEVAKNAIQAAENTSMTMDKAQKGAEGVDNVVKAINEVHSQTSGLKTDMLKLGEQAENIGAVINVITDIADQTNLLALNAAIEAARAGEAGRGFAVVADEVRKLAEKTMGATTEVNNAISAIQESCSRNIKSTEFTAAAVSSSTKLADEAGSILNEIVTYADDSSVQVQSIATASEQQSATADEINNATEDVNRISQETGQAMEDASRSVAEVNNMVQSLNLLIQQMVS